MTRRTRTQSRLWRRASGWLVPWSVILLILAPNVARGQFWESYVYANDLRGIAAAPEGIYCATAGGAILFDPDQGTFQQWNREINGLASDSLTCVARDPSGHIWFGTATQGISVFDPQRSVFTPFTSLLEPIPSDEIRNIVVQDGWTLVFARGGFSVFEDGEFRWICAEGIDDAVCDVPGWDLRTGAVFENRVWVGARRSGDDPGGVANLDVTSGEWSDASEGLDDISINDMEVHQSGLWVVSDSSVAVWNNDVPGQWTRRKEGLPRSTRWTDLHSGHGTLWLGSSKGVFEWDPAAETWARVGSDSMPVGRVVSDADGRLWAGASSDAAGVVRMSSSEDGLWEFGGSEWIQHRELGPQFLHHYRDLTFDERGRLWTSTAMDGQVPLLSQLERGDWSFISKGTRGLLFGWTFKLFPDGESMWLGNCCCRQSVEFCYAEVLTPEGTRRYSEAVNTRDMDKDDQGRIWFCSFNDFPEWAFGLTRLDPSDSTWLQVLTTTEGSELKSNSIRTLRVDGRFLWIGYAQSGASRWDLGSDREPLTGDDSWVHYSSDDSFNRLTTNFVTTIQVGPDAVWIGTSAGATLIEGNNEVLIRPGFGRLPAGEVMDMLPTPDGGAWVATRRSGFTRMRPDGRGDFTYETFGPPGLVNPDVETMALDPDGRSLWLGTAWGLTRFQPSVAGSDEVERPGAFPNPFKPICGQSLRLLGISGTVDGVIVDSEGRVLTRFQEAAPGDIVWDGRVGGLLAAPGLYMIRVRSSRGVHSIPLALLDGDCGS
jgi:ligand-binding sensor domain-containing protein